MAQRIAQAVLLAPRLVEEAGTEIVRTAIVCACAIALIAAGPALPL